MGLSPAEQYELIVRDIIQTRLRDYHGTPEKISLRQKIVGASGQAHEMDLSFELEIADTLLLFVVECKCYSRAVGVDDLAEFAYKMRDIGANKGIVVTTSDFSSGAVKLAERERIALVIARSDEGRWETHRALGRLPGPQREYRVYKPNYVALGETAYAKLCYLPAYDSEYVEGGHFLGTGSESPAPGSVFRAAQYFLRTLEPFFADAATSTGDEAGRSDAAY